MRRTIIRAVACAAVILVAGCTSRAQEPPPAGEPAAELRATADFGAETLLRARVAPGQSVMEGLRGATEVRTAYAGGFVAEMLGRTSDPGGRRDWFFYVDGLLADAGARDVRIDDRDDIWWDHHSWAGIQDAWAVVGAWPAPFAGGADTPAVAADPPLRAALGRAGARLVDGPADFRVRVGSHESVLADPAWRRATADPDRAGLTGAVEGGRITLLDAAGERREAVPGARALAVAAPTRARVGDGALMVVVGLDAGAADAAARRIAEDAEVLRGRFSVAFDGRGEPLRAAGRSGP